MTDEVRDFCKRLAPDKSFIEALDEMYKEKMRRDSERIERLVWGYDDSGKMKIVNIFEFTRPK